MRSKGKLKNSYSQYPNHDSQPTDLSNRDTSIVENWS